MKVTLEYTTRLATQQGREELYVEDVTITGNLISAGDDIVAMLSIDSTGRAAWVDPRNDEPVVVTIEDTERT